MTDEPLSTAEPCTVAPMHSGYVNPTHYAAFMAFIAHQLAEHDIDIAGVVIECGQVVETDTPGNVQLTFTATRGDLTLPFRMVVRGAAEPEFSADGWHDGAAELIAEQ